jgi:hypothetical protein
LICTRNNHLYIQEGTMNNQELDPAGKLEDCYGNMEKSVEYLVTNF